MASRAETLDLELCLRRLPSVQHQVGLGALTALLKTLGDDAPEHVITSDALHLTLTPSALATLLTHLYASAEVTRITSTRPKDGPFETTLVEEGYGQTSTLYTTKELRPKGEWLAKLGYSEALITAWRNGIWSHLRDRPKMRMVYDAPPTDLAEDLWKAITKSKSLPLSSALMIGARAANAEGVPFEDKAEHVLLLHCQHALAHITPIVRVSPTGDLDFQGIAWVAPVPLTLDTFTPRTPELPTRVTHAQDAALALLSTVPPQSVAGAFCAHLDKQGHNVNLRDTDYLPLEMPLLDPYKTIAPITSLKLRELMMKNLLRDRPLHCDLSELPELSDAKAKFQPYRDCHHLAKDLQPNSYQQLHRHALTLIEQKASKRFPHLTWQEYQQGRGYPERREKFRDSWLSISRQLLSQVRTARTRKLLEPLVPNLQADWQEQRDTLALALASCAHIAREEETP